MNIDDSIIKEYLSGGNTYKEHWLFYSITENGEYTYSQPQEDLKERVNQLHALVMDKLQDFHPFNQQLFMELFPTWRGLIKNINVLLSVGCPDPYDAMVREHGGKDYIIFDMARLIGYGNTIDELASVIRSMITHEFAHVCIHNDYPQKPFGYADKLKFITFDEGFAHLLAFNEDIMSYDFSEITAKYYDESLEKLKTALKETDEAKQVKLLDEANCGKYWSKFASIGGKLYLASHRNSLSSIYKEGPDLMISKMIL